MGTNQTTAELVDLIQRREAFVSLLRDAPRERKAVQQELEVSRSTAYRALQELETHGLVVRTERGYEATLFGSLVLELHRHFETNFANLNEHSDAFVPLTATPLDLDLVLDGEIYTRGDVEEPGVIMVERAKRCDRFLAVAGVHRPELLDPLHERLTDSGLEAAIVMHTDIIEYIWTYAPDKVEGVLESGNLELYRLDEPFPWGMTMTEEARYREVTVAIHDDLNPVPSVLVNDSERAVSRFLEIFESTKDRSERVTFSDL